jgi:hypothetical protein
MVFQPATRDLGFDYLVQHYDVFVKDNGIFAASTLPNYGGYYCSVEKANAIEAVLRPKVEQYKRGGLSLDRTVEQVRDCGVLQQKLGTRISDAVHGK